jgi:hypothetical protein
MAQATVETTAPGRRAGASDAPPARLRRDPKTGRMLPREAAIEEPTESRESALAETSVHIEAGHPEPPEEEEDDVVIDPSVPDHHEPSDDEEDEDAPEDAETSVSRQALIAQRTTHERTKALLAEALRLGLSQGLIERRQDGSFALPGDVRPPRLTSDCACATCSPQNQRHWWCVVCGSGPHDWLMNKPQFERQTLKAGGIEGARQAACSGQCAKDYIQSLGRQPSGVPTGQTVDPTLALP